MTELEPFVPMAHAIARDYYLPGGDRDDVVQEAMIGVWLGVSSWDPAGGMELKPWVRATVRCRLNSAVKAALRFKHLVLSEAGREFAYVPGPDDDLVDVVEARRRLRLVLEHPLQPREREAVTRLLRGEVIHAGGGALEQALVRARRKLRAVAA